MKPMYRANLRSGEPITEALVSKETKNDVWFSVDGHGESLERKATFSHEWFDSKQDAVDRVGEIIMCDLSDTQEALTDAQDRLSELSDIIDNDDNIKG